MEIASSLEPLIVVGCGGASRSIAWAVADINRRSPTWNLLGFLDDDPARLGQSVDGYPVLGPLSSAGDYRSSRFVIGIANQRVPPVRQTVAERLALPDERYAILVHPTACVSPSAELGPGTVVLCQCVIDPGVKIGRHSIISHCCVIGHDATLGDYVTAASQVKISGSVRVGDGVYLGSSCVVLQELTVGEYSLLGIGAVVVGDVPPHITVFGNPARPAVGTRKR